MSHPFWSDDFDMDLLKVFPEIEAALGATASVSLRTLGHTSHDRLNHPAVWNTHAGTSAFLWLGPIPHLRDERGWISINGCVTNSPEVECTWLEWLRDAWVHSYNFVLFPTGVQFISVWGEDFERIMSYRRGWSNDPDVEDAYVDAWIWLTTVNARFARCVESHRLSTGEDNPYFVRGTVPGYGCPQPILNLDTALSRQK